MSYQCDILIVDDEPIVGERLKAFIKKDGHRVETFVEPSAALKRLEEKDFDIVISDIRMLPCCPGAARSRARPPGP